MRKQMSLPPQHTHIARRKSANPGCNKKKKTPTDDSFIAFAPRNICNVESLHLLSPSSFKEDVRIVDNRKAGNTDKQGNKCLRMLWISTGIYLLCRHIQDKVVTSAWIYGRGSRMLRLLMDCWKVWYIQRQGHVEYLDLITAELIALAVWLVFFLFSFACLLNETEHKWSPIRSRILFGGSLHGSGRCDLQGRKKIEYWNTWGKLPDKAGVTRVQAFSFLVDWKTWLKR